MATEHQPEAPAVPAVTRWRVREEAITAAAEAIDAEFRETDGRSRPRWSRDLAIIALEAAMEQQDGAVYEPAPESAPGSSQDPGSPDDTARARTAAPDGPRERTGMVPPLDRESLREIVRNAVANWWTAPVPSEKIADALWPLLEHMQAAAAGSHEGVRLWMADCGELAAKHRERAGYWRKRWTAACERADEDGRQAVSQHVRILELEQRAEAAEAKLAEVRSTVTAFLAHYGNSTAASFQRAADLAHGVLQVIDRAPLEAQERGGGEAGGS